MVSDACLSDACSVVSDGVGWFSGWSNDKSVMANCAYIVLPRSFKTTYISIKPTRPTTKALWLIVHTDSVASFFQNHVYINKTYQTNDKSIMANCAYIVLPRSFKTTHISIKPTRPTTKALWLIVHI